MVLVGQDFRVVMRGSPATDVFIMRHEDIPNKELYATKRMVHITEEGPGEYLFNLERPSLDFSIASAVVPPEEGVDRSRDKENKETPLPILPSGSRGITVAEADITTLCREGISVDNDNDPAPDTVIQFDNVLPTPSSLTIDVEPQLDFWRQLEWDMVDNTLDEETEAGGVDGIQPKSRRGALGDHELVTAPKCCGKWLVDENKWRRVKQPYQKQICNNRSSDCQKKYKEVLQMR